MSWADTAAVVAMAETVPILSDAVFVSQIPEARSPMQPPYLMVHPSDGTDVDDRWTGPARVENPAFTLHVVGSSANQVQVITALLKAKFVTAGFVTPPPVTGRSGRAGYWRCPLPIQSDESVPPAFLWMVVEVGWQSVPA